MKTQRIDLRVQEELKGRFSAAAEVVGMNLTTFVIAAAQEQAVRILRSRQAVMLTDRDRDLFLAALDRPVRPIPESMKRAKRHHATKVIDG